MDPRISAQDVMQCDLCETAVVQMHCDTCLVNLYFNDLSKLFGAKFNIERYKKLPQKIVPSIPKFKTGKNHEKELHKMFGALALSSLTSAEHYYSMKISPEAVSSPPVKQLLDEPEAVTTIDTGYNFYLFHVAFLTEEKIWTRGDDSTMKLFSINQGSLLKSIRTKSGNIPYDMTVTKSGDLVYTDYNDGTVNIMKNVKIEEVIRLWDWIPRGVCSTSSGELLVIMRIVDKYT
ncbi:uncharacterized protein LOC134250031 [Saccostrea cucullata]|uniref:uncharacterized protein LOC134250031 n=1 Tax=Saccostrea cuccullata TaxID=36930 RepID=UPI002ED009B5